ncbi:MAG TPA: hypothetical protein VFR97_02470 [Capillimicrobium sp.]|nr:hypothetical protein [Capillimicrobium sp.]
MATRAPEHPSSAAGNQPPSPTSNTRWIIAAIVAGAIVAGAVVVLVFTVFSSDDGDSASDYQQRVAQIMAPVIDANERLSNRLAALRGRRARGARAAVHATREATLAAQGGLAALTVPDDQQQASTNARGTLTREEAYLAAVDAALSNPASGSADQTQTLAANLTDALNAISPPGENWAASVTGAARLTTWAARIEHKRDRRHQQRQDDDDSDSSSSAAQAAAPPTGPVTGTDCGNGIVAGPNTTCPFARNVRDAYYDAPGSVTTVDVWSPVTQRTYTMTCAPAGTGISCAGGNSASVSFP